MKRLRIPQLGPEPDAPFPPVSRALREPDGLLAFGGDLDGVRLLNAYRHGIFPWFSEGQPVLWWSPDPRSVFDTDGIRLGTRFKRQLRHLDWEIRADHDFEAVIRACASVSRPGQHGTWITEGMIEAYLSLHRQGHAHSIEVRSDGELIGGVYGVAIGRMFFGESMFSRVSGASKAALAGLAWRLRGWGWPLIDAQVGNDHTASLGARSMPRANFMIEVSRLCALPAETGNWQDRIAPFPASLLSAI